MLRVDDGAVGIDQEAPAICDLGPDAERPVRWHHGAVPVGQQVEGELELLAELGV